MAIDPALQAWLLRIETESKDQRKELSQKLDELKTVMSKHMEASGIRDAKMESAIETQAKRMAEHEQHHKDIRGWWATIWGGLIVAVALSLWNWWKEKKGGSP